MSPITCEPTKEEIVRKSWWESGGFLRFEGFGFWFGESLRFGILEYICELVRRAGKWIEEVNLLFWAFVDLWQLNGVIRRSLRTESGG